MRLGIIARCDNRGIAYQSFEAVEALNPHAILLVMMNDKKWPEHPERFRGKQNVITVNSDMSTRGLDETKMRKFLDGLDAMFTVETVYDWRLLHMAEEMDVRTVIQGNPEFYTHREHPDRPHPDMWAWPTKWMLEDLTDAELEMSTVLPVPAPRAERLAASTDQEVLRVLHVAGHRAIGDRNGTDLFYESLASINTRVHVTVVGQDGQLPTPRLGKFVSYEAQPGGFPDRWDLYRNQHLVVLPRRYGGLCLPALEATCSGVIPMMPDTPENKSWPTIGIPAQRGRLQRVPRGLVETWALRPTAIAHEIDKLNRNRDRLAEHQEACLTWAQDNSWSSWRPAYEDVLRG